MSPYPIAQATTKVAEYGLPPRAGLGLKPEHFRNVLDLCPDLGFFEVHAENYMVPGGPMHHYLGLVRERYPLSLHGVGLSIGGDAPLDKSHLDALALLMDRYAPQALSEHLAWSSHGSHFLNDLLPLPYTQTTLNRVCDHIDQVQTHLGCHMLLENPATYLEFASSTLSETDFMCEIVRRTGCALLLDINNAYVTCINHNRNPEEYIRALPLDRVEQIHLAGFASQVDAGGAPLLIDNHGAPVANEVWTLYGEVLSLTGPLPTLIERDNDIPPFNQLLSEANLAEAFLIQSRYCHG